MAGGGGRAADAGGVLFQGGGPFCFAGAIAAFAETVPWDKWIALPAVSERRSKAVFRAGQMRTLADRAAAAVGELHKALAAALSSPMVLDNGALTAHVIRVCHSFRCCAFRAVCTCHSGVSRC